MSKKLDIFHLHRDMLLRFEEFKEAFSRDLCFNQLKVDPPSNKMAENQQ
ncbi:hypothetical protein PanWU01x14_051900 [Parasponia andersonii]|uniref:Uncharacterized protein n=1 Tax=Parasponia andersonii TaxID=3476 RepID=A0A2P5DM43_PARAD|nr:hypothetical protein PanWU01x14_051900 [Parasponia andersonii]